MPRNVRNFWLNLCVSGRKSNVETGPRSASGGFDLEILMRENGSISDERIVIQGRVVPDSDGQLIEIVGETNKGERLFSKTLRR